MVRALALAFAALVALPAHAQPSRTQPIAAAGSAAPTATAPVVRSGSRKSPVAAVAISLGVTAGSLALTLSAGGDDPLLSPFAIGFLVGPSTGHWYAGRAFNPAMVVRAAAFSVALVSTITLVRCGYDDSQDGCGLAGGGLLVGGLTYSIATVCEIFNAAGSATAYNRRHGWDVTVAPTALSAARGASPGVSLIGRF